MWTGAYWAKSYWTGVYWAPADGVVAAISEWIIRHRRRGRR